MKVSFQTARFAVMAGAAACFASANAVNLVANGDFEAGNSGFSSDYTYVAPGFNVMYPEGLYTIDTNPFNNHDLFTSMGDHTSGSGNMMIVNGVNGGTVVWEQTIAGLTAATMYTFSFYASSVYPTSPATLDIQVDGVSIGSQSLTGTTNQWDLFSNSFVATADSHVLSIVDLNAEASGNDFAIDDVTMVVPEPASMAALAIGAAAMLRRRARR